MESRFPLVWIQGEISNFRIPSSGHYYFSLKDAHAQIRAVMFRYQNESLTFIPEDGLYVVALGRLTLYEPRGEYQIVLETMEPKGYGALQLAFEQLKERLEKEGLFSPERKKPLPFLPQRMAVVTSPTGAAIRDFLKVLKRRYSNMEVLIYPVRVQGNEAAGEIVEALDRINRELQVDVIVITRGGGSLEDLWPFNREEVARAIARSRIPVLSAVGHEVDFTIADFVADKRSPTPSAAAEMLVKSKDDLMATVENYRYMLLRRMTRNVQMLNERLQGLERGLVDPRGRLADQMLRVDELSGLLSVHVKSLIERKVNQVRSFRDALNERALLERCSNMQGRVASYDKTLKWLMVKTIDHHRHILERTVKSLGVANPLEVLKRGYSITRSLPGLEIIADAENVRKGDQVQVLLAKGHLVCRVDETSPQGPGMKNDREIR